MNTYKCLRALIIFLIIVGWMFSGWPQIWLKPPFPPKIQEAQAAVAFQASSSIAASTGADVTVTLPTHQTGDIFLLQVVVRDTDDTITVTDWTQITTITDGTAAKHWWFWKRAASASETNPLVDKSTTSGDTYASVTSYRGAAPSGDPWEAKGTASCTGTTNPFTLNGVTTLTNGSLVVATFNDIDNFFASASYSATDPATLNSDMFNQSPTGSDGSNCSGSAVKTSADGTGNVTVTLSKDPDGACGVVLGLKPNIAPSLTVSQPDGVDDTVTVGASYNITYDLSDSDSVATVDFYYDTDNSGLDGTAITGCQDQAEGSGAICSWDTTGMTLGDYYVYGIATDGTTDVNDYSPGVITIQAAAPSLSFSISDNSIGFSALNTSAPRFATGDGNGSDTEVSAHTLEVSISNAGGYSITVKGDTLKYGSYEITAIGGTAQDVSTGGTEQFGIRLTVSGGGSVVAPYNGASNYYAYAANATTEDEVASFSGTSDTSTFSVYYAANIATTTEAGTYTSTLTYIATGNF